MSGRRTKNPGDKKSPAEKLKVNLIGLSPEEVLADLLRVKPTPAMPRGTGEKPYTKSGATLTEKPRRGPRRPKGGE